MVGGFQAAILVPVNGIKMVCRIRNGEKYKK